MWAEEVESSLRWRPVGLCWPLADLWVPKDRALMHPVGGLQAAAES